MKILLYLHCAFLAQPANELHFRAKVSGVIDVIAPLNEIQRQLIPPGTLTAPQGEAWLRLCLVDGRSGKPGPPMLGNYRRDDAALIFSPRFGLEAGKTYRVFFGRAADTAITKDYRPAPRNGASPPTVVKILPSGDVLPANVLKFYIYFSRPMRGGQEIFSQFEILDADGNVVSDAWLTDELWDETGQILILYIHPGRIKWGVVLRDVLGPVLLPRREYTFVVRGTIADADGRTMGVDFRKKFRTIAEDRTRIELKDWKIARPQAGTMEPITVRFPKALDHKSLERFLTIQHESSKLVSGKGAIGKDQKSWTWVPEQAWQNADYHLIVGGRLEDVAGNTPLRPFDMDLQTRAPAAQRLEISFRPR